jgi:hypothetical protein
VVILAWLGCIPAAMCSFRTDGLLPVAGGGEVTASGGIGRPTTFDHDVGGAAVQGAFGLTDRVAVSIAVGAGGDIDHDPDTKAIFGSMLDVRVRVLTEEKNRLNLTTLTGFNETEDSADVHAGVVASFPATRRVRP